MNKDLALCVVGRRVPPMKAPLHFLWALGPVLALACNKSEPAPAASPTGTVSSPVSIAPSGLVGVGTVAPPIDAVAHTGEHITLAGLQGKPVVVYFYPKDDTPGCTKEACEIRDAWAKLQETGAVVLGISTDDAQSHIAFASKYNLPFKLIPDPTGAIAQAYGVPVRMGYTKRVTFIVDRHGKIVKVFPDVNPAGHAAEILGALSGLST
jgi:peroxiredoxin Q/BCP